MAYVYNDALNAAREELLSAVRQRDHWTMEVARLEQLVKSLAITMLKNQQQDAQPDVIGFQELVLTVVRTAGVLMSASDVRNQLALIGHDLSRYQNPLAVIYSALKRLTKNRQLWEPEPGKYAAVPNIVAAPDFKPKLGHHKLDKQIRDGNK
jgi:hypothetical protein